MATKKVTPEVDEIESFDDRLAGMVDYCEGVQFDGPLPTDLKDPDPFPPGDEEETTKSEIHSIATVLGV